MSSWPCTSFLRVLKCTQTSQSTPSIKQCFVFLAFERWLKFIRAGARHQPLQPVWLHTSWPWFQTLKFNRWVLLNIRISWLTFYRKFILVGLMFGRALHTFNVCFCLPKTRSKFRVFTNQLLQLDISCRAMLFKVNCHLIDFVLKQLSVFFRKGERLLCWLKTLFYILLHSELVLNCFQLGAQTFWIDILGS